MKKKKSDSLIKRLIENQISRKEFDELLEGLEDEEMASQLEKSLRGYFDKVMEDYKKIGDIKNKTPGVTGNNS